MQQNKRWICPSYASTSYTNFLFNNRPASISFELLATDVCARDDAAREHLRAIMSWAQEQGLVESVPGIC